MALGTSDRDAEAARATQTEHVRPVPQNHSTISTGLEHGLVSAIDGVRAILKTTSAMLSRITAALARTTVGRYISSSLLRRIIISNLLGLTILLVGALYLSQFNKWLIDSKSENMQARAATLANALSADVVGNPNREPNPFADFELKLDPGKVIRRMRHYMKGVPDRARVYFTTGDLIYDSKRAIRPDNAFSRNRVTAKPEAKPKNLWTRLTQQLLRSDLPVYKDPGHANVSSIRGVRDALKGAAQPMILLNTVGQQLVSIATPIVSRDETIGVLLFSTHPSVIDKAADEQRMMILGFAVCALVAAIIASYLLAQTVAGPMRQLSEVAEDVTRNIHSAAHLPKFDDRADEVGRLTRAFKSMTASLYGRIEASEKFAADVAHELKNPLAAARSTAEAFDYAKTDEQRDMLVQQIQEEIARLNMLITDVSNASRLDADLMLQKSEPINLVTTCQDVVNTFSDLLSDSGKSVELHYDAAAHASGAYVVSGQRGRLGQVLTNLIDNAVSFSPAPGRIDVRLQRDGPDVLLIVEDQGPGIDPDQLDKIFTRFYTFRPGENASRGNNSGLGLSISREIVRAHGGEIWAENRVLTKDGNDDDQSVAGARFTVRLAAADANATPRSVRRRFSDLLGARPKS